MAQKYFAQIGGEQHGPYNLEELADAGVGPDTYVWTKGMADWEQARNVADICRYFRQRLAGMTPNNITEQPTNSRETTSKPEGDLGNVFSDLMNQAREQMEREIEERRNPKEAPAVPMLLAVLTAVFCFPPTGIFAVYYCLKAQKIWEGAPAGEDGREKRVASHEMARRAKMLTGITFFLGFITMAFLSRSGFHLF